MVRPEEEAEGFAPETIAGLGGSRLTTGAVLDAAKKLQSLKNGWKGIRGRIRENSGHRND